MTRTVRDKAVGDRLRELLHAKYPSRGRFALLAGESGLTESKWKNFFYRRQEATTEMLYFWCNKYPNDQAWLMTGVRVPDGADFPFSAPVPKNWEGQTIGDRLNWVITEWAAPTGDSLFKYLEEKSNNTIPADAWAKVVMRLSEPTAEMIRVVCSRRPYFTEWVVLGSGYCMQPATDPTDAHSVASWKAWNEAEFARTVQALHPTPVPNGTSE